MSDPATPPAEEPTPDPTPVVEPVDPPVDDFDKDRAMNTIRQQREEAKALKERLREAEAKAQQLDEIEEANKTELQRAIDDVARLKAESDGRALQLRDANLKVALAKHPIADAETVAALIAGKIEYADDGTPKDLDEIVESLLADKPFLKAETAVKPTLPPTDAGAGQGEGPAPSLTAEELQFAQQSGQSPQEFALVKQAIEEDGSLTADRWQQIQTQLNQG